MRKFKEMAQKEEHLHLESLRKNTLMSKLIDKLKNARKQPEALVELSRIRRMVSIKNSGTRLHTIQNSGGNNPPNSARRGNVFVPLEDA